MHSTELTVSVQRTNIKADYSFACVFIILETYKVRQGNVTSLYMPWGASERTLGNSLKPNQKDIRTEQGETKPYYSCYDEFFGPESYGQKGEGKKVHG